MDKMSNVILAVIFLLLTLLSAAMYKAYFYLPITELKRRAQQGDSTAQKLYRVAAYDGSLQVWMWLVMAVTSAASFVLFTRVTSPWLSFLVIALVVLWLFGWLPRTRPGPVTTTLALWMAPLIVWKLNFLHPVLDRLAGLFHKRTPQVHTGLYEPTDFLNLIDRQAAQPDNRLLEAELDRARRALTFSRQTARDILTPRKKVRTVSPGDDITPMLASELHDSGHASFPVYDKVGKSIVGILPLHAITDISHVKQGGTVADVMQTQVAHLHESDSLSDILDAFYKTKQSLFVVINNFEEYVGIVTVEDLLSALAGQPAASDFNEHQDRSAVAHRHDKKEEPPEAEEPEHDVIEIDDEPFEPPAPEPEAETPSDSDDKVVE